MKIQDTFSNVGIEPVVARAKFELGISNTSESDFVLEKIAQEAAPHLYNEETKTVHHVCLDLVDGVVDVPCGYESFIMAFVDGIEYVYVNDEWYRAHDCECTVPIDMRHYGTVKRNYNKLDFGSDLNTEAELWYWGLNVDEKGNIVVRPDDVEPLAYAVCANYYRRMQNLQMSREYQAIYIAAKKNLRGVVAIRRSKEDRPSIQAMMNGFSTAQQYRDAFRALAISGNPFWNWRSSGFGTPVGW